MKTEPKSPDWEVLVGMVERVTYQTRRTAFVSSG
jgi:hypothetical protein